MNTTVLSFVSALAAAAWSVWTWKSERQKERDLKRDEMSALFVTSLLLTAQELQRRLYRILEEDELAYYRAEYPEPYDPASPPAIDLLHTLSLFFGWELMTLRYGPYIRDAGMIAIMAQIGDVLESRTHFPGDAFRFTLSDRHGLAEGALKQVGETGSTPSFVSVPRYEFEEDLCDERSERAKLYRSKPVRSTLAAIDRADRPDALEGHERLAALQNLLVDLCSYLEEEEEIRIHVGERQRVGAREADDYPIAIETAEINILHRMSGRVRLGIPRLRTDVNFAARLQLLLESLNNVEGVRINVGAACVVIYHSAHIPQDVFISSASAEIEEALHNYPGRPDKMHV